METLKQPIYVFVKQIYPKRHSRPLQMWFIGMRISFYGLYNAHRIRMYAIYGNIYHQYTPVMLASIYH